MRGWADSACRTEMSEPRRTAGRLAGGDVGTLPARAGGRAGTQRLRGTHFKRLGRLVVEFAPFAVGLRPESGRQAAYRRLLVLAENQTAVAEDPGAGDDDGQRQRFARQVQG